VIRKYFKLLAVSQFLIGNPLRHDTRFPSGIAITAGRNPSPDLNKLTVKALRRIATDRRIKGRSKARRKADLIRLIEAAQ